MSRFAGFGAAVRDVLVIARFDLAESLRSRRALIFLALYVAGATGGVVLFTEVLQTVEEQLAEQLLVARTNQPGSLTEAVMQSPELHDVLSRLVGSSTLATTLLGQPPVALVYHWIALTFSPAFVALTASDAISSEVATGSVRYALFRTDRSAWATGKLVGQCALLAMGLSLGAVGAWTAGFVQLASFEEGRTAVWLARYVCTAFVFAFAHLGLVMGISQLTRSVPWSRALGLMAVVMVFSAHSWLGGERAQDAAPVLAATLQQLIPVAHRLPLWLPDWNAMAPSAAVLAALGVSFFVAGHQRFLRRDA